MKKTTVGNVKATRADWLEAALAVLIASGVESVRILTLSRRMKVSRSSFYWYFKNRDDLLAQLLEQWRQTNTRYIVERARRPSGSVTEGVLNIFECWVDPTLFDPQLDFAVRAWARRSGAVRRIIDRADQERVQAIAEMYERHGYPSVDAFVRARILYFMQIGYYSLGLTETMESRVSLVPAYLRGFTSRDGSPEELAAFLHFTQQASVAQQRKRGRG